jgi:hypothetical protein
MCESGLKRPTLWFEGPRSFWARHSLRRTAIIALLSPGHHLPIRFMCSSLSGSTCTGRFHPPAMDRLDATRNYTEEFLTARCVTAVSSPQVTQSINE